MRCMDVDDFIALTKFDGLRRLIPAVCAQLVKEPGLLIPLLLLFTFSGTVCCYCSFLVVITA
ncbi:hypothetical protein CC79DRAFT_186444 [Sarocladium strictum]|jgi:hypothetical protein